MVLSPDSGGTTGTTNARLRSKVTLGVGVTVVHEALGAGDARDGIDGRSHAIWSVVASTSAVVFRSVRVLHDKEKRIEEFELSIMNRMSRRT